jgi:DNA-binding IclR family transcriptional regulator
VERSVSAVGVLDKAVAVLDALSAAPASLGQVAAATDLPKATAHRLLHALEVHGLTARTPGELWSLGPHLAQLGALAGGGLVEAARPALAALRDATGESVQLYVVRGDVRVCVLALESPHGLRTIVAPGAELPMTAGSAAKVLRPDAATRRRGWAQSVEEREPGVASVSAPVMDGDDVVAAVSVSGPVGRMTRSPGRLHAAAVVAAARAVEERAGLR